MALASLLAPFRHPVTKKVRRIVRRTVVVLAVILAVAFVTTISIDVGPALKELAETQGSRYIERPMHIGRLEARLWDGSYIVHDLRIEGLDPQGTPFLTAKRIVVSMPWSTLFNRRVVFDSIEMSDWRMHVETLANGKHNFPRFTRERRGPRSVWTTTLQYVRAHRGEFTYQDYGTPWGIVTRNLDVTVTRLGTDYRGTARFADGLVAIQSYVPFRADMTSNFRIDGGRVVFGRIDLLTEGAKTVLVGDTNLSFWPELMFSMKSTIDFPRMREIFFAGDDFTLSGTSVFNGTFHLFKEPAPTGGTRTGRELKGEFESTVAGVNRYRFENLKGSVRWTPELLEVTDASANVYGGASQFTYKMAPLNAKGVTPTASFDARYENVDLAIISDLFELEGVRFAGRLSGRNLLEWPLRRYSQRTMIGEVRATPPEGAALMTRDMPMARIAAQDARGPIMGPFSPLTPFEPVPVGGEVVYTMSPDWIEVSEGRFATSATYVEMQGRTRYGSDSRFPFHVSSADWQESDRLFAGILTAFGSKTGAIPVGGYGTFDGVMTGEFRRPRVEGEFSGERMRAWNVVWGSVRGSTVIENSYANVKDVVITSAPSIIKTTGRYSLGFPRRDGGEEINAHIEIINRPAADLRHAFNIDEYQIDGTLSGEFDIKGGYLRPFGAGRMTIVDGRIYGEPIDSAAANVRLEGEGARMDNILISKKGGDGRGNAYIGWNGTYSFTFDGRSIPVESIEATRALQVPVAGTLAFKSGGSGSFDAPRYDVSITLSDLFVADEGIGQVNGRINVAAGSMTLDVDAASPRLQVDGHGTIALNEEMDAQLTFNVHDTSLDPYVRVYLPRLSPFTTAVATGSVFVRGELKDIDHLLVDATVDKLDLRLFDYALSNPRPIRIALDRHAVDIKDMRLEGQETQLDVTGRANLHDETLSLRANGDANLAVLQGFISNIKSSGTANLSASLEGPLRDPAATGRLAIENGRIRHFALPHALEELNGAVQFDEKGVTLDGLTGQLARGDVRFTGRIDKEGYLPGRLNVTMTGTDMQLRFPQGMRRSLVDATLSVQGTVEDATVSGLVNVKDALYTRAFDTGAGFFEFGGDDNARPASAGSTSTTTIPLKYDIRIVAPGTLQVRNNTLRLVADADLQLRGTYDRPVVFGHVEVLSGDALVEAKRFVITRGTIDFNNPTRIEPFFDIEAEARIRVPGETYRVTVRAAGPPDRLRNFALTSDPPLPESDLLALIFGDVALGGNAEFARYNTQITPAQQLAREQAARALTGTLSSEVSRVAQKTLGIDAFRITPSLSDPAALSPRLEPGARVTIFQRVSDRVSLTYSRSLATPTTVQIVILEYDVSDKFSWILSRNEDGTYAVDWQIRRNY